MALEESLIKGLIDLFTFYRKPRSQGSLLPALPIGWVGQNPGNEVAKHGTTIFFPITILF